MVPCMGAGPREAARGRVDLKRGAGINNVPTRAKYQYRTLAHTPQTLAGR
jgi:hypothetical protein